jgi:hypothetical protein
MPAPKALIPYNEVHPGLPEGIPEFLHGHYLESQAGQELPQFPFGPPFPKAFSFNIEILFNLPAFLAETGFRRAKQCDAARLSYSSARSS